MEDNELKNDCLKLRRINNIENEYLKDCLNKIPKEGLEELYNLYDTKQKNRKTKQGKINFLCQEIVSTFIDDYLYMMNKQARDKYVDICAGKVSDIDHDVIHFFLFGYIFIDESDRLIIPNDLYWYLDKFLYEMTKDLK